jgi:hypothetical protein
MQEILSNQELSELEYVQLSIPRSFTLSLDVDQLLNY